MRGEAFRDQRGLSIQLPLYPWQASQYRRIMATRREQHKAMPDCIVKAQALPDMKERAD
jgi:hypothetical protein